MRELSRARWIASMTACAASAIAAAGSLAAAQPSPVAPHGTPEAVQRALLLALLAFDDLAWPAALPIAEVEARLARTAAPLADPRYRAGLQAFDQRAPGGAGFAALPLAAARAVVQAWIDGEDDGGRRFIGSIKALAMIAAYSAPAMWPAIGYDGPFEKSLR